MEDEKKVVDLDEKQLKQVAGGNGDVPYTLCDEYRMLLDIKNTRSEDDFRGALDHTLRTGCGYLERDFSCYDCPVHGAWRREYDV